MRILILAACMVAALPMGGGCAAAPGRYYDFCCVRSGALLADRVQVMLSDHGFDSVDCGGSFAVSDLDLRGSQETQFRARALMLKKIEEHGWGIGWPADSIILQDKWDQIGFAKGPWTRIASVQHRVSPSEQVYARLESAGFQSIFMFGETTDFVLVHCEDAQRVAELLRAEGLSGVVVHKPSF